MPLWITCTRSGGTSNKRSTSLRVSSETAITASADLDRGALHPAAQMVARAKLLDLPRPQRLERVDRQHRRNVPQLLGQKAGHIGVPGMAVDDIGVEGVLGHRQAALKRVQRAGETRVGVVLEPRPSSRSRAPAGSARRRADRRSSALRPAPAWTARGSGTRHARPRRRTHWVDTRWCKRRLCVARPRLSLLRLRGCSASIVQLAANLPVRRAGKAAQHTLTACYVPRAETAIHILKDVAGLPVADGLHRQRPGARML